MSAVEIDTPFLLVRRGVDARRADRGLKAALAEFASHCGLSERRVRGIYHGEVTRLWCDETALLRRKAAEWLAADIARLEAKIALDRARYAALTAGR